MAGNEINNLYSDTSSAKQNLKEASSKAQEAIRRKKEIQARMESLRRAIQSAAAESEEAKEEYGRLAAELASIPDDDEDDESGYGGNFAMRQAIMSQMLAAQQRHQAAERKKQAYVQELERKKKEYQQLQNELNMLRIRLQNLREMFESLKQRYAREKEKARNASNRFGRIQSESKNKGNVDKDRDIAIAKQKIYAKGVQFCENQKQIADGWARTIEQAQGPGHQQEQGDSGRDYE